MKYNPLPTAMILPPEIDTLQEFLFKPHTLLLSDVVQESESQDYSAHRFSLNNRKIIFRLAKMTPKKTGQFVSIWHRNEAGSTRPLHMNDDFDFVIIAAKTPLYFGVFIFSKHLLHTRKIVSDDRTEGKRGIRVYPVWDQVHNPQALKTQSWQTAYFIQISGYENLDPEKVKKLFSQPGAAISGIPDRKQAEMQKNE